MYNSIHNHDFAYLRTGNFFRRAHLVPPLAAEPVFRRRSAIYYGYPESCARRLFLPSSRRSALYSAGRCSLAQSFAIRAASEPALFVEWPTSTLAARIWSLFGWQGSSIVPIQAVRMLVGALGLVFFFLALNRLVNKRWLALLATIGLGVSDAYWIYSTHMDQSINMLTLLCLAFYLFVRQSQTGSTSETNTFWRRCWPSPVITLPRPSAH